jgi:hypothetical protein
VASATAILSLARPDRELLYPIEHPDEAAQRI